MTRPDRPRDPALLPESESNPPEDRSVGWKPWTTKEGKSERWWTGKQWTEGYK